MRAKGRRGSWKIAITILAVILLASSLTPALARVTRDPNQSCMYCHYGPFAQSTTVVYELPASAVVSDHRLDSSLLYIPGSTKSKNLALKCLTCHTDHTGVGAIPGTPLLRTDPFGDGGSCTDRSQFCADCHDIPYRLDIFRNHPLNRVANNITAFRDVTSCESCHSEGFDEIGDYPHQGLSHEFLGKGADQAVVYSNNVDSNCLKCHVDQYPNPIRGVSYTF